MLKKLSATGLVAIALCLCCAFSLKAKVAQQPVNIKIEDYPNAFQNKEPVKIIGLYLGTTLLKSGEDFNADKDWLRDLRIMVKNVSDQSIRNIILNLDVKTDDPNVEMLRIDIHYGRGYLYSREPDTKTPEILLTPGAFASFGYNTKAYEGLRSHLASVRHGKLSLQSVVFEDIDKGWYAPTYAVRCGTSWCADPDKPYQRQPQTQDGPQDLTVQQRYMTEPTLAILNARRTDEVLTVEVQNRGIALIEYFELHLGGVRVSACINSTTESLRDDPKNLVQAELSLAPQEVRTFQFPVKGGESFLKIETVLLSNGQGWHREVWMKKLDKPNERGALWMFDADENERRGLRVVRSKS